MSSQNRRSDEENEDYSSKRGDVSIKEHFNAILNERLRAYSDTLRANERELDAKGQVLEARLERMNEFRDQMEKERADFATKEALFGVLDRMNKVENRNANQDGRFWMLGAGLGIGLTILSILVNVLLKFMKF